MTANFDSYIFRIGSRLAPLNVMLAGRRDRGNIFPAIKLRPVILNSYESHYEVDMNRSCFENVTENSMSAPIPLGIARRAVRDFKKVADPSQEALNLSHENIPHVIASYSCGWAKTYDQFRDLLCIRP